MGGAGAGNHLLAYMTPDESGRHAPRLALGLVVLAVVPFLGPFASIAVPYDVALCRRAGLEGRPLIRWAAAVIAVIVTSIGAAYWLDASGCL